MACIPPIGRIVLLAATLGLGSLSARAEEAQSQSRAPSALFQDRASVQETLLATRQQYAAWVVSQPAMRQAVELGPWWAASLAPSAAEAVLRLSDPLPRNPWRGKGPSPWALRPDLVDGKVARTLGGPADRRWILVRKIGARRAGSLTIGIGAGDRLELWLNGHRIADATTHLVSGRYGCDYRFDGTRVDQILVDLDLKAGDNVLAAGVAPGEEPSFYFSMAPNPVPRFWEWIDRRFPRAQNPLLDLMPADWRETGGWFGSQSSEPEEQLADRLAGDCGPQGGAIRDELARCRQAKADRQAPCWLDLCVKSAVLATLSRDLTRLRLAVEELSRSQGAAYPCAELVERLDDYRRRLDRQAAGRLDPADAASRELMAELRRMQRQMLVDRNPLLRDRELLFVKRHTYDSKHYYDDFQHIRRWGGNLCVLSLAGGQVRRVAPELEGGVFDRYDLSFDGKRIVFGYRRPRNEGFRIFEIGVDGRGLRQVTRVPEDEQRRIATYGQTSTGDSFYGSLGYQFWTDDLHPCYLPGGDICFASTRCEHGVLCTPLHYLACTNLFRMDAEGNGIRPISRGALSEFTPTIMEDGRILYNRWEYVYKGIAAVQPLWTMRPDGSGSEEFYGNNIANPGVLWQARQVPGRPRLAVAIGCGHEPLGIGQVLLLDLNKEKRTPKPMVSLTPEVKTQGLRGLYQLRNGVWREDIYGPFYSDPYPLSDKFFLVSCNPDRRYNDLAGYGIYLLDAFGNRVPIYSDPEISCWQPMPLGARRTPPVLPDVGGPSPEQSPAATVFLRDVYRGLPGVAKGTVKYLRVMEQVPRPWSAELDCSRGEDRGADGFGGHLAISWNTHIWVAVLRGIVPVGEDGSACFEVPANRNLFFQALDSEFMEVQRMRTFVNFVPGENRSCIGCHEHRTEAPALRQFAASGVSPLKLAAQPGETAPRALYYPTDVQPILDRHCVACHDGKDSKRAPDLRGEMTTLFNRSYESILQAGLVKVVREWNGGNYAMENAEATPPYTFGSHASRFTQVLRAGHYDVKLSREEWVKLVTWIDCGAPYYGSYFGRRHLQYEGEPDFRPVPSLESACGIAPEPPKCLASPNPLPARLIGQWSLGDPGTVVDSSGRAHATRVVGTARSDGPHGRGARRFDGTGYVECRGLGAHEALSIALWVKPDILESTWSPLVFTNDGQPGSVHFSLRADGAPNVAVNTGKASWTHRKAQAAVALGKWVHLALVCDGRRGGVARFYVDGRPVNALPLSAGRRLDLDAFRIGAYNGWQQNPSQNFHGEIAQVRIYTGMLTDEEVSRLAQQR